MDKQEFINLLVSNHYYYYEDAENTISIRIKNRCFLTLCFKDNLLVNYNEKIKYYGWWKWTTLKAMLWREIICFVFFVLIALLDDLFIGFGNMHYVINIYLFVGIITLIMGLSHYFYFFNQIKKTKNTLQLI